MTPKSRRAGSMTGIILIFAACLLTFAGCLDTASGPQGNAPVAGTWRYTGQQTTGTTATLTGTMTFTSQSLVAYGGSLDVLETIAGGPQRRLAGPITGRIVNGVSLDFDITLGAQHRQHIGALAADTISGTWFEMGANGGVSAGGSFRAVRERS